MSKTKKTKRPIGPIVKEYASKAVVGITGPTHFVLKSAADITVQAEALAVHKLTGKAKSASIEDRHNKTEETQASIISAFSIGRKEFDNMLDDLTSHGQEDIV